MQKGKASSTAGDAAGTRALHALFEAPVIFDDPYALDFASRNFRKIAANRVLRFFVMRFVFSKIRPVAGQVLARARVFSTRPIPLTVRNTGTRLIACGKWFLILILNLMRRSFRSNFPKLRSKGMGRGSRSRPVRDGAPRIGRSSRSPNFPAA